MASCPFCEDVEAPPGSCPLHGHHEPRWKDDDAADRVGEVHLRAADRRQKVLHDTYTRGYQDGLRNGMVVMACLAAFLGALILLLVIS